MDLSFKLDPEIFIGADSLSLAGSICGRYGQRIMVAADHDLDSKIVNRLKDILKDSGIEAIVFDGIREDSPVSMADNVVELSCAAHCNAIAGIGGYKTQLISRIAAITAPARVTAFELLDGRRITNKFLPLISIPTAGFDPFMFCEYFIAPDPRDRLVKSVSSHGGEFAAVIADSGIFQFPAGMEAAFLFEGLLTVIEAYCSAKANFLSDSLLERALNFFAKLIKGSRGINADVFAQASFLASLGSFVSSAGPGAALSLAVNTRSSAAKPLCSASLLPAVAQRLVNTRPEKMARAASYLGNTGRPGSVAEGANAAVDSIRRCMEALNVKTGLKEFGISLDKTMPAAAAIRNLEFISNSPWIVSEEELLDILKQIV